MAEVNPPFVIQASSHPADVFRRLVRTLFIAGVVNGGDMAVTQNGAPNMSVNVAAGEAVLLGTENALSQGSYLVQNDATKNLTIAASDPTNPRNDLVVAKVQDAAYSGATNAWSLAVVTGTPAPSPADPATPNNAIVLARVRVNATVTTITNATITDLRPTAAAKASGGVSFLANLFSTAAAVVTGLFQPVANVVAFATNSLERMRIDAGGNVGIGTTNPVALLHINGGANSHGTLVLTGNNGTAYTYISAPGSAGAVVTGAAVGDLALRVGSGQVVHLDATGGSLPTVRIGAGNHIISGGSTPTLSNQQGGTVVTSISLAGNDTAGMISIVTGTTPPGPGTQISNVSFATAYGTQPVIRAGPSNSGGAVNFVASISGGAIFVIWTGPGGAVLNSSTTYTVDYHVIGRN